MSQKQFKNRENTHWYTWWCSHSKIFFQSPKFCGSRSYWVCSCVSEYNDNWKRRGNAILTLPSNITIRQHCQNIRILQVPLRYAYIGKSSHGGKGDGRLLVCTLICCCKLVAPWQRWQNRRYSVPLLVLC